MSQTILIVNGDATIRQWVEQVLHKTGFHTTLVENAQQALDFITTQRPHAIIVDDELAGMSGGQLCRKIKTASLTCDIPVVMHSNGLRVTHPEYVTATGADVALHKPVSMEVVLKAVQSVIQPA